MLVSVTGWASKYLSGTWTVFEGVDWRKYEFYVPVIGRTYSREASHCDERSRTWRWQSQEESGFTRLSFEMRWATSEHCSWRITGCSLPQPA
jgi:hypothetical protein